MAPHSRCFALLSAEDQTPAVCKWKAGTKKHGPQVAFNETYSNVRHASTISLNEWTMELYQINELTSTTSITDVFNVPLVSELLVYPVILRVSGTAEVPSLGRVKRLLCEYLIQNADQTFFPEEDEIEEEAADLPSLSEEEPPELPDDDDEHSMDEESDVMEEEDDVLDNEDNDDEDEPDVLEDDD